MSGPRTSQNGSRAIKSCSTTAPKNAKECARNDFYYFHHPCPNLPTSSLVPKSSYMHDWSIQYDEYFSNAALPIDFPISGIDFGNPANGPRLNAMAEELAAAPQMNASEFRNWYKAFSEFCLCWL